MDATSLQFKENARAALADPILRQALDKARVGFSAMRRKAYDRLPEFEALREEAKRVKDHTLAHLDFYLETFEKNVIANGGSVHWARNAEEARAIVLGICKRLEARTVTKGKSMISEEIGLNQYLKANGVTPIETDMGEYVIQLRNEPPSHLLAPAFHLIREQWTDAFRAAHTDLPPDRPLEEPRALADEGRAVLRDRFLAADVGVTGANFLIAETGAVVIVTNEGNGDLTQTLPKAHIVVASIEKAAPTLDDAMTLLRLLARSSTGQEISTYVTFSAGSKRASDLDGPGEYHVVLLDNGRSAMLGTEFQDMLRCIRCSACLNHCPVYLSVGGHAYGWVYSGPMGAVLTPSLIGVEAAGHLPNASTFCGKCESVCPVKIPLPKMMRHWRERQWDSGKESKRYRAGLKLWAFFARRPALYRWGCELAARLLGKHGAPRRRFGSFPLAGAWTRGRDLPTSEGRSFMSLWAERQRQGKPR
ncbi:MAG: LutB/LldF family L-lactate oxidation iron-sulfur protein [Roseiarcus sp.]|jgi:L-lactate dehydrogenase complex protein LldF